MIENWRHYDVIEVYPLSPKILIFGDKILRKSAPEGLPFLRERFTALIGGLEDVSGGLTASACNAAMNAYLDFCTKRKHRRYRRLRRRYRGDTKTAQLTNYASDSPGLSRTAAPLSPAHSHDPLPSFGFLNLFRFAGTQLGGQST